MSININKHYFKYRDQVNECDAYSIKLMQSVVDSVTGAIILTTVVNASTCSVLKTFQANPSSYVSIELNGINQDATTNLVNKVFQSYSLPPLPNIIIQKVYHISGGNPLYIYEMAKAMGQRCQQLLNAVPLE